MKERPIIFNAEMVNAILSGRKTQTRRPVKFPFIDRNIGCELSGNELAGEIAAGNFWNSTFGQPGDQLWVRESYQGPLIPEEEISDLNGANSDKFYTPKYCEYAADGGPRPEYVDGDDNTRYGWRPSIHMPRWASRITLEITGARVERLNSISDADMRAEGMRWKEEFPCLWESIYGAESWQANPLGH